MENELRNIANKLKSYGLNDEQVLEIMNDIYKVSTEIAYKMAQEEVNSALDSLARFGR